MGQWSCCLEANAVHEGLDPAVFPCSGLFSCCPLPLLTAKDSMEVAITCLAKACLVTGVC